MITIQVILTNLNETQNKPHSTVRVKMPHNID